MILALLAGLLAVMAWANGPRRWAGIGVVVPPITPGPAWLSSRSSSVPSVACPHGLPAARTCPFLATTAGAIATTFKNTTGSPARIFSVAATTSADRSPSCTGAPPFSGETRHRSGTATITPAGRSPSSAETLAERPTAG